ncbi:MAG: hypothetical protein ABI210_11235 [Abditibacteriaceae bacterium]
MRHNSKSWCYLGVVLISWILILAVPSFRAMFLAQSIRGSYGSLEGGTLPAAIPHPEPNFSALAKQHPDSFSLKLRAIADEKAWEEMRDIQNLFSSPNITTPAVTKQNVTEQIDALPDEFPKSPLALAYALNNSFSQMHSIRRAGILDDPDGYENKKKGIPSPERVGKRDYTQQQWQHVIDLCRRGQKLAPQNAYFDVVEANWQFAEFHDVAAWAAISRADDKSTFDTYSVDFGRNNVQAHEIAYGRSLYWEELENNSANFFNFSAPLYAPMRELGRLVEWEGAKAEIRGNNKKALRIYDQSFQVMHLWYQSSPVLIEKIMAEGIEALALDGPGVAGVKPDKNTEQRAADLSRFKNYILSIHRPDQLRYLKMDKDDYTNNFALQNELNQSQAPYTLRAFTRYLLWRIGIVLLWLLTGGLLVWLVSSFCIKVLLQNEARENCVLLSKDYWRGAITFAALPISIVLLLCYAFSFYHKIAGQTPDFYGVMENLQILSSSHISPWRLTNFGIATAILFSIAYALRRIAYLHREPDVPRILLWEHFIGTLGSLLFVTCWVTFASGNWPFPVDSQVLYQAINGLLFGTTNDYNSGTTFALAASGLIIGFVIYLFLTTYQWSKVGDRKAAFHDFWHLLSGSALRWLALASVLYLLTLAIAIPIRAPLRERAMQRANYGELSVLKTKP